MLVILVSLAEVLSLGAVLPFIGVMIQPEELWKHHLIGPVFSALGVKSAGELRLPITLIFISFTLLSGVMRLLHLYVSNRLTFAIGADFSYDMYRRTLFQPYSIHVARNSSVIHAGLGKVEVAISGFLNPVVMLFGNIVIFIGLLSTLLVIDPIVSILTFIGFTTIYFIITKVSRHKLTDFSRSLSVNDIRVSKAVHEGLGGIRDVLLDASQDIFTEEYRLADRPRRHAQAGMIIISSSPRFAVEAVGMSFIALVAYWLAGQTTSMTSSTMTTLGVLALGAQRMLPMLQQGYISYTQIMGNRHSLYDALELLNQPIDESVYGKNRINLRFEKSIVLNNVAFQYTSEAPFVLNFLNLEIQKGSRIGFMGPTGSGKSTLIDIIMGLLEPTDGNIEIDGVPLVANNRRSWQQQIAHVPQSIYLSDVSIAENIAFGVQAKDIDIDRVKHAAKLAQIAHFIESQPKSYQTFVGERGVRLSGGQRQRIGIARALYKNATVIVFDEATSALDNETEKAVIDAVETIGRDVTIIMIAHRLTTLQRCDLIFELSNGQVVRSGSYATMVD
ncbi:MAG: ABC transporter ATP-binding protein [Leptonema sp. (in: Bacteria)]|nr:ABC transporter ATP-binding protein [Leptonema sp. (in: bacteria)]